MRFIDSPGCDVKYVPNKWPLVFWEYKNKHEHWSGPLMNSHARRLCGPGINYYLCSGKGNIDLGEWRKRGLMTGIFLVIKMKWEREKICWIQTPDASQGASAYVKAVDLYIDWLTAIASCKANIKSPVKQSKFNVTKRRSWLLASQRNYLLLKSKSLQSNTSFTPSGTFANSALVAVIDLCCHGDETAHQ